MGHEDGAANGAADKKGHDGERLLTPAEVARILGITSEAVRALNNRGRLPALRTPSGRRLFRREDVDRMAAERAEGTRRRAAHGGLRERPKVAVETPAARAPPDASNGHSLAEFGHGVQFYESEDDLSKVVARFLCAGLAIGDSLVIIATPKHRSAIEERIRAAGHETRTAEARGRLIFLDAQTLLGELISESRPQWEPFRTRVGRVLEWTLTTSASGRIRVYGEMVDLLWRGGQPHAALRLEEMWNDLQKAYPFTLLCGYSMESAREQSAALRRICALHDHVSVLAEGFATREFAGPEPAPPTAGEPHDDPKPGFVAVIRDTPSLGTAGSEVLALAQRTEQLMRVTAAIAGAVTREQVLEAVVDQTSAALGASSAGLWLLDLATGTTTLVHAVGYRRSSLAAFRDVPLDSSSRFPILDTIQSNEPIWIRSQQELLERYPDLAPHLTPGRNYGTCSLPISVDGRPVGALAFTFEYHSVDAQNERNLLLLVARYSAQALGRLQLLEAERKSRAYAEASALRLSILSGATRTFADAGLDLPVRFQRIADQVTPALADFCALMLLAPDGRRLQLHALHHRDPAAADALCALVDAHPQQVGEGILGRVVATGKPLFLPSVPPEALVEMTFTPYRSWMERYPPHSLIALPLRVRGQAVGVLAVSREHPSPAFVPEEFNLIEELAERAALAVESSQLHRDNQIARGRAELLYRLAATINAAQQPHEVFQPALDAIEDGLGVNRGAILLFDEDDVMRFQAWRGISDEYRRAVEGHSPWSRTNQRPEPVLVSDVRSDPSLSSYAETFRKENIAALGFIPLYGGGELLGKFMLYYAEPHGFSPAELGLAAAIANHVSAALARLQAHDKLQRALRFSELFTGILGHDLRNPLSAILTGAEVAMHQSHGDRLQKPLELIASSGQRMSRMIGQLLDFTRARVGGGMPLVAARIDLLPVLSHVADELETAYPKRALRLESRGSSEGTWDGDRLAQVFSNLLANALQHGDPAEPVRVSVDGTQADTVVVRVSNRGGIAPKVLSRLFEPMTGAAQSRSGARGLGLGLFISREIIQAHRGRIHVESTESGDTVFTVSLPRSARTPGTENPT